MQMCLVCDEHIKQEKKKLWHLLKKMIPSVDEVCYQTAGSTLI